MPDHDDGPPVETAEAVRLLMIELAGVDMIVR